jgi:hypothetical protein
LRDLLTGLLAKPLCAHLHNPEKFPMNLAHILNQGCQCVTLDPARLQQELARNGSLKELAHQLVHTHPHLFSGSVVFVSTATYQAMAEAIGAIERVMALPQYEAHALEHAPAIAQRKFGPRSVFMGYDFHVDASGGTGAALAGQPRLIEINTNAGGAMLSAALARSQRACCQPMADGLQYNTRLDTLDQTWFDMFLNEWRLQRGDAPLRQLVIVDDAPQDQYLAPEFAMFRQLFQSRGVLAHIAGPEQLAWRDGKLWLDDPQQDLPDGQAVPWPIDLVYNRLTDFDLSAPAHQVLREAYESGAAVLTPHPHAHALRANKRNLAILSNDTLLAQWGVARQDLETLHNAIPETLLCIEQLAAGREDALWAGRRKLFFKPVAGYGGKSAYRGEKLTKRVWQDVLAGDFVAQAFAPPGQRVLHVDGVDTALKFDIRAYTYQGQIQLLTARTYSGQTTNFRTPGGGFSPVLVVPDLNVLTEPTLSAEAPACAPTPCAC